MIKSSVNFTSDLKSLHFFFKLENHFSFVKEILILLHLIALLRFHTEVRSDGWDFLSSSSYQCSCFLDFFKTFWMLCLTIPLLLIKVIFHLLLHLLEFVCFKNSFNEFFCSNVSGFIILMFFDIVIECLR